MVSRHVRNIHSSMGNVGQSMSVQPLLPIGENTLGKKEMDYNVCEAGGNSVLATYFFVIYPRHFLFNLNECIFFFVLLYFVAQYHFFLYVLVKIMMHCIATNMGYRIFPT